MIRHALLTLAVVILFGALALPASPKREPARPGLAVRVVNRSQPTLCAETDNVSLTFQSRELRRFRIEAAYPSYVNMLAMDSIEPDWSSCDMKNDPVVAAEPRVVRLYEADDVALVGYTNAGFWRKNSVPFRIGEHVESGLHLVQLWLGKPGKANEVLVVYPPDGYWRARPLPLQQLGAASYGSSFLVGPVDQDAGRPVVNLQEIAFDPTQRAFTLRFANGSSARMKLVRADAERVTLEVEYDRPLNDKRPFAALRSMYVTEYNADVARIALKEPGAKGWREATIMGFDSALASEVWTGRVVPSRHNTSAPDMVFHKFER